MKVLLIGLIILIGLTNLVFSGKLKEKEREKEKEKEKECPGFFNLDCLYETWFGEDSSSEEDSSEEIIVGLSHAVSKLSNTIQKTLFEQEDSLEIPPFPKIKDKSANVEQIPSIVSYLENLTKQLKKLSSSSSHSAGSSHEGEKHTNVAKEVSKMNKLMETLTGRIQNLEAKSNLVETKPAEEAQPAEEPAPEE